MCEPTTILAISAFASAGSAVLGYVQAGREADAQAKALQADYDQKQLSINEEQNQINMNATDQKSQRAKEALIEQGRLRAIQGESGLVGNSSDRIMAESGFNAGTDIAAIEGNRQNTIKQSELERQGLRTSTQSKLAQIKQPSLIGTGLQIAGAGLNYKTGVNALKTK